MRVYRSSRGDLLYIRTVEGNKKEAMLTKAGYGEWFEVNAFIETKEWLQQSGWVPCSMQEYIKLCKKETL